MARFGFRGGSFRSGSRGNRSSSGRRSAGKRKGNRSSAKSKGARKASQKGVVAYSIYNSRGKRTYVGTTADPERRAAQHAKAGKLRRGGELVVESKRMPRREAERLEAKKIDGIQEKDGAAAKRQQDI